MGKPNVQLAHDGKLVSDSNPLPVTASTTDPVSTAIGTKTDASATTDTGTFSLISLFKRLLTKFTAFTNAAGTFLHVTSVGYAAAVTITRPANTTAYAAGDVIGDTGGSAIIEFTNMGPAGGHVVISAAELRINLSAVPSGMTTFRLHLYDAAPDAKADNDAWDLSSSGDRGKYLGYIDLGAPQDLGSSLFAEFPFPVGKQVKLASAATSLYGLLQTVGAFTPTSGEVYVPNLRSIAA
ncbi:MAG TPA: hypothetical protein VEB22_03690 [Phycisphaerales bacterium]|nr:hypothetical protein [Phycisphaerales bacterium]